MRGLSVWVCCLLIVDATLASHSARCRGLASIVRQHSQAGTAKQQHKQQAIQKSGDASIAAAAETQADWAPAESHDDSLQPYLLMDQLQAQQQPLRQLDVQHQQQVRQPCAIKQKQQQQDLQLQYHTPAGYEPSRQLLAAATQQQHADRAKKAPAKSAQAGAAGVQLAKRPAQLEASQRQQQQQQPPSGVAENAAKKDWIMLLEAPTATISSPQQGQVIPAAAAGTANVPFDGTDSTAERAQTLVKYVWKVASDPPGEFSKAVAGGPERAKFAESLKPGQYSVSLVVYSSTGKNSSVDGMAVSVGFEVQEPNAPLGSAGEGPGAAAAGSEPGQGEPGAEVPPEAAATATGAQMRRVDAPGDSEPSAGAAKGSEQQPGPKPSSNSSSSSSSSTGRNSKVPQANSSSSAAGSQSTPASPGSSNNQGSHSSSKQPEPAGKKAPPSGKDAAAAAAAAAGGLNPPDSTPGSSSNPTPPATSQPAAGSSSGGSSSSSDQQPANPPVGSASGGTGGSATPPAPEPPPTDSPKDSPPTPPTPPAPPIGAPAAPPPPQPAQQPPKATTPPVTPTPAAAPPPAAGPPPTTPPANLPPPIQPPAAPQPTTPVPPAATAVPPAPPTTPPASTPTSQPITPPQAPPAIPAPTPPAAPAAPAPAEPAPVPPPPAATPDPTPAPGPATPPPAAPAPPATPPSPPSQPPPTPAPPPATPPPPAAPVPGPITDQNYCNEYQDYDIKTRSDDWDALQACCDDARKVNIIDSDCTAPLPPRPVEEDDATNNNPTNAPTTNDDYCTPGDYDFTKPDDVQSWKDCCQGAEMQHVQDKDCANIKV